MTVDDDIARIRRGYAAWNSGDVDQLVETVGDDIEVRPVLGEGVSADTFTGKEGIRRWYEAVHGSLVDFTAELLDLEEVGPGRYLAMLRFSGRGAASGAAVTLDAAHLLTIRDGLLVRLVGYESWDEARRAF